jgi:hypothetical protein
MGEKGGVRHGRLGLHAGRATDRAHALALGTWFPGAGVELTGAALAAAPPELDDELCVEYSCDCGAHGAHQVLTK